MREEDLVDYWCKELDLENEGWLDKGENGNAYSISNNRVIKITSDYNEFISTYRISKSENPNLPKIYDFRIFSNGELGILMEELITSDVENIYNQAEEIANQQGVDICDIDLDEIEDVDKELKKFIEDVSHSKYIYELEGVGSFDIQPSNIGLNSFGNYVLFDQTNKNTNDYNEDVFMDIKQELMENFIMEEPINKTIEINNIFIDHEVLGNAYKSACNGEYSYSDNPIECQYNKDGLLQVIGGFNS